MKPYYVASRHSGDVIKSFASTMRRSELIKNFDHVFDTWEEAKEYLESEQIKRIRDLKAMLIKSNKALIEIAQMKPPTE